MALYPRIAGRSLRRLQAVLQRPAPPAHRTFQTAQLVLRTLPRSDNLTRCNPRRRFATSVERSITGQEAPSAQAYIQSGVFSGSQNLVNVKKVLVIGSGGLSIGQAGEFDYSGTHMLRDSHMDANLEIVPILKLADLYYSTAHRIPSSKSLERSQCCFNTNQSQYSHHTNRPQAC